MNRSYLFSVAAEILGSIALLVTDRTVEYNLSRVRVHVFLELQQFVGFVFTLCTPVLVDTVVIVCTGHHSVVLEKAFPTDLTAIRELLCVSGFPMVF